MCCKNCDKREVGCHGTCTEYQKWKENERNKNVWLSTMNSSYGSRSKRYGYLYGDSVLKKRMGAYK